MPDRVSSEMPGLARATESWVLLTCWSGSMLVVTNQTLQSPSINKLTIYINTMCSYSLGVYKYKGGTNRTRNILPLNTLTRQLTETISLHRLVQTVQEYTLTHARTHGLGLHLCPREDILKQSEHMETKNAERLLSLLSHSYRHIWSIRALALACMLLEYRNLIRYCV